MAVLRICSSVVERFVHIEEADGPSPSKSTMKKAIFLSVWVFLLLVSVFTLLRYIPLAFVTSTPIGLIKFIKIGFGLLGFSFLFLQIVLGEYLCELSEKLGKWVFKFHFVGSILTYLIIFLHALLFMAIKYFDGSGIDPYLAFVSACVICKNPADFYKSVGMVSFWFLTAFTVIFTFKGPFGWFEKHMGKLHVFNYLAFFLAGIHIFVLGTTFRFQPFYAFAILAYATACCLFLFRRVLVLYKEFKEWLE